MLRPRYAPAAAAHGAAASGGGVAGPILVCGMGNVGWRIVQLLRRLREDVVVVTRDTRAEWARGAAAGGVRVLLGDAREEGLLAEAGVGRAAALVAASDHDPTNIEIALDAKRVRPELPVVVRLFDPHFARHVESAFDIRRAF